MGTFWSFFQTNHGTWVLNLIWINLIKHYWAHEKLNCSTIMYRFSKLCIASQYDLVLCNFEEFHSGGYFEPWQPNSKTSLSCVDPRGLNMNKLHVGIKNGDNRPWNKKRIGNDQGICQIFEMKFPDFSLIYPWLFYSWSCLLTFTIINIT